jgi:putative ABC transport system ATP-binding protein
MIDSSQHVSTPLLEVRDLTRHCPSGTVLLANVSLSVRAGERLAVTGESGSGKTVLLRCLARLDPCEGEIRWEGRPVPAAKIPRYRSEVMYLPQASPGWEGTVEENLRLPLTLGTHCSRTFSREQVLSRLERLGKGEDFLERRFSDLSGGERQIVALLRALPLEPRLLLLDEASSALDPRSEEVFEQLIAEWLQANIRPRGLIWVTHDESQRQRVSDREIRIERPPATEVKA